MAHGARRWIVAALLLTSACGGGPEPTASTLPKATTGATAPPPDPCTIAAAHRARVPKLLTEGRIDRVVRILDRADALCPASAKESNEARARAIAELADDRTADQLYDAALAAKAAGKREEMQRLYDKAMARLERDTKLKVVVDLPPGTRSGSGLQWAKDGSWVVFLAESSLSIHERRVGFRETRRVRLSDAKVQVIALSPNGKTLAAGTMDNRLHLIDVATWTVTKTMVHEPDRTEVPRDFVDSIAFSPDGSTMAVSTGDGGFGGNVRLWDVARGTEIRKFEGPRSGGSSIAFSKDGKTVSTPTWQEGIRVWDVKTGSVLAPAERKFFEDKATKAAERWQPKGRFDATELSPDGKIAAVILAPPNKPLELHLLNVASGAATAVPGPLPPQASTLSFSPDGTMLAVESYVGTSLVDVAAAKIARPFDPPSDEAETGVIALSRDGAQLAVGSQANWLRLWSFGAHPTVRKLVQEQSTLGSVVFSRDGKRLVSVSSGGVRYWDTVTGFDIGGLSAPASSHLAVSPDGETLAVAGNSDIELRAMPGGHLQRKLTAPGGSSIGDVAFSRDGKTIAAATFEGRIHAWDVATGKERGIVKGSEFVFAQADGAIITTAEETARIVSLRTGGESEPFVGHRGQIHALALSPDGNTLASGSEDGTIRLWDVATFAETQKIEVGAPVWKLEFLPNGAALVDSHRSIALWSTSGAPLCGLRALKEVDGGYAYTLGDAPLVEIAGPAMDAARDALRCRVGSIVYPFDLCRERYEVEGLAAKALAGDASAIEP